MFKPRDTPDQKSWTMIMMTSLSCCFHTSRFHQQARSVAWSPYITSLAEDSIKFNRCCRIADVCRLLEIDNKYPKILGYFG